MRGLVIKSTGSWYLVKSDENAIYECRIKGKFRMKGIKSTNPIAVGDLVEFSLEEGSNNGVISEIYDRKNYIIRKSVNLSKQTHIIASNIDLAFLVITLSKPSTSTGFIDRFLATAAAYRIETVLVFNKIDIYREEEISQMEYLINAYSKIGYSCIKLSALKSENIEQVKLLMKDKVSMFSGHSGVGKSTLINAIEQGLEIKTMEVSSSHNKGQHTTTFAEMHPLSFGGHIIDTPGIKGFGLVDMQANELSDYFPEIFKHKANCKFNNCLHVNEPKCAVKKALEDGEIEEFRYLSYLSFLNNEDEHYRTGDYN